MILGRPTRFAYLILSDYFPQFMYEDNQKLFENKQCTSRCLINIALISTKHVSLFLKLEHDHYCGYSGIEGLYLPHVAQSIIIEQCSKVLVRLMGECVLAEKGFGYFFQVHLNYFYVKGPVEWNGNMKSYLRILRSIFRYVGCKQNRT